MPGYENLELSQGFNVYVKCPLADGHTFANFSPIKDEFNPTAQRDYRRSTKVQLDDYHVSVYHIVISDFLNIWQWWDGRYNVCWNQLWMTWDLAAGLRGEAAFYGPEWHQTRQLLGKETFYCQRPSAKQPELLQYIGADGEEHRQRFAKVVFSTMERCNILIENYKGAFPTPTAPHQDYSYRLTERKHVNYAWEVAKLRDREFIESQNGHIRNYNSDPCFK